MPADARFDARCEARFTNAPTSEMKPLRRTIEPLLPGRRTKLAFIWTCSDFVYHEHRWKFTAWICGRAQLLIRMIQSM